MEHLFRLKESCHLSVQGANEFKSICKKEIDILTQYEKMHCKFCGRLHTALQHGSMVETSISIINLNTNGSGSRQLPCGTHESISLDSLFKPSTTATSFRFVSKDRVHFSSFPLLPNAESLHNILSCGSELNAFEKSM